MSRAKESSRRQAIDWPAARATVAAAEARLRRVLEGDPTMYEQLLAERARELARPEAAPITPGRPVLVLRTAAGRFALPLEAALRVEPLRRWTPIPQAPPELLGIAAFAGTPCLIADLFTLVGGQGEPPPAGHAVLLRRDDCAVALYVAHVEDVRTFQAPAETEPIGRHVLAVDAGRVGLLDVAAIVDRVLHWMASP